MFGEKGKAYIFDRGCRDLYTAGFIQVRDEDMNMRRPKEQQFVRGPFLWLKRRLFWTEDHLF